MNTGRARQYARANRQATLVCVAAYIAACRICLPDPVARAEWHFVLVLTFGYGHLLGAAVSRRAAPGAGRLGLPAAAMVIVAAGAMPFAYASLVAAVPSLLLALLGVSLWHTVENDAAFRSWYRRDFRAARVGSSAARHAEIIAATLLVMALATSMLDASAGARLSPDATNAAVAFALRLATLGLGSVLARRRQRRARRRAALLVALSIALPAGPAAAIGFEFADVFAATTLYHLVSWSIALLHRIRAGAGRTALAARVALCHALPACISLAACLAPQSIAEPVSAVLFSPGLYLYYSLLHIVQTLWARRAAPH